jgi:heptosyltransferase-2
MVAFYSALSGDTDVASDRPQLHIEETESASALATMGLSRGGYYVFAPGAEFGSAKRWPAAHFSELASQLELPVVLLGSAKEFALCEEIAGPVNALQPGKCLNFAGKTSLAPAFIAILATKSIVSNDSGLMHVAAAFGVPQIAIFGSSSPLHTPPLSDKATIIWLKNDAVYQPPLDCSPCFERECPLGHTRCLNDVLPSSVLVQMMNLR